MSRGTRLGPIQMKGLGDLHALEKTLSDTTPSVVIGTIIGKVSGIGYRDSKNPEVPSIVLLGIFEGIPADPDRPKLIGPQAFLPQGFCKIIEQELVAAGRIKLKDVPKKAPAKGKGIDLAGIAEIAIAVEIEIERNTGGGVPYKFVCTQRNEKEPSASDPLAELRQFVALPGTSMKALPAPKKSRSKKK